MSWENDFSVRNGDPPDVVDPPALADVADDRAVLVVRLYREEHAQVVLAQATDGDSR